MIVQVLKCDEPNEEREISGVEQLDIRDTPLGNELNLATKDVDQPNEDKGIGNERSRTELRQIPDQSEGQEDHQLHEDEVLHRDQLQAVRDPQNKGLQVLRDEDGVGSDEADLGDDDGSKDGIAHPWAVERPTDV